MTVIDCVGYVRVSTERQVGEQLTSLSDQEKAITALAERLGVTVGSWYRDEGVSGSKVETRPAFFAMLTDCQAQPRKRSHPGYVLVLNDSRFGRFEDPDQAAALRFQLKQSGWIVRFAEGDDVQDVTFRSVIRSLGSAQASEYRRAIVRNAKRGARGTAELGYWTREAPIGYRRKVVYPAGSERILEIGTLKAPNEKVTLAIHDGEAAIIRWAFETYASGSTSLGTLMRELEERLPGRRWSRTGLAAILRNPTYLGDIVGGRRTKDDTGREIHTTVCEHYGRANAHPAIVDQALFQAVQDRLSLNRGQVRGKPGDYVLTGLIHCAHCGSYYSGGGGGRNRNKRPQRALQRFYKDTGGTSHPVRCEGRIGTIARHLLDDAVISTLASVIGGPAVRKHIAKALDVAIAAREADCNGLATQLTAERETLEKKRDRLITSIADGTVTQSEAAAQLNRLRTGIARLSAQIDRASQPAPTVISKAERDRLLAVALDFPTLVQRVSGLELRELIRPWLQSATFDKVSRSLRLEIRSIPAVSPLLSSNAPGQD